MVEEMYERSPGFFKQFQKNNKYFISEEILIFLVSRTLPFAWIFRISTVIITLLIITMLSSTSRSSQQFFSNKQNPVQCPFFLQISSIWPHLRIHWRQREMFFKNSCWQWSRQKQFHRILKSRHYCFRTKAIANVYENCHRQISTTRMLTTKPCWTQKFGSKCIEAEKSNNWNWSNNSWNSEKISIDSLWTSCWNFLVK